MTRPAASSSSSAACACGRLRRATRALTRLYDDLMLPAGLRVTQFSLLRTLAREQTHRMSDLADILLIERTALSRTLDPLVERGLVAIAPGRDARTREVSLTRAGEKAIRAAEPQWALAQQQVAATLGEAKLDALIELLGEVEKLEPEAHARSRRSAQPARASL